MSSTTVAVSASPSTLPKRTSLPVINIGPYLEGGDKAGRLSASAAIHAACLEYGFFYLDVSQYADPAEPVELTRLAREFFALPQEDGPNLQNRSPELWLFPLQRVFAKVVHGSRSNLRPADGYLSRRL